MIGPTDVNYLANIYALKAAGCTHVIASGAVGSLREEVQPKDVVIPDQIIDKTTRRVPTFFDQAAAVHVERSGQPVLPGASQAPAELCLRSQDPRPRRRHVRVHGRAGVFHAGRKRNAPGLGRHAHRHDGCAEFKLAREAELAYALVCLPSDYDCWRPAPASCPNTNF